jgi:hypothetical protein
MIDVDWGHVVTGIVSSIFATLIAGFISVVAVFRPLLKAARTALEKSLRPVNEIQDIAAFSELLDESLAKFEGDYRRLVLYRALPCEISPQFLNHCFGDNSADEAREALRRYSDCISHIVKQGRGAHDKTIFGRTGIERLDAATRDACLHDYFHADEAVDTSELGLHSNFDEIGILLLGETFEERNDNLKEWQAGFIIVFSQDFKTVRGFRHNVHGHIENLRVIFDARRKDSEAKQDYFILNSKMDRITVVKLKKKITNFFSLINRQ